MTQALNTRLRLTGIAGALALAATLLTAPASYAGDRGDRWDRDRNHRVERHYDRSRNVRHHRRVERRAYRTHRRAHRRHDRRAHRHHGHRHGHYYRRHRHDHSLAPVALGIGLGILTYAIIDSHHSY